MQDTLDLLLTVEHEMGKLQEREAEVVRSLVIQGIRAKDYAAEHHLDVSHVYRIQRRALGKLRQWMGVGEPQKQPEKG
jgi:RNA polymerase sporulation-specific sigma factor